MVIVERMAAANLALAIWRGDEYMLNFLCANKTRGTFFISFSFIFSINNFKILTK